MAIARMTANSRNSLVDERRLRIHLLRGNELPLHQMDVAFIIELRVREQCAIARKRGLREPELHLKGPRVDFRQHLSLVHAIAFVEAHLHQLPVDSRFHRDRVVRGDGAESVQVDGDARAGRIGHDDRNEIASAAATPATTTSAAAASVWADATRRACGTAGAPHRVTCDTDDNHEQHEPDRAAAPRLHGTREWLTSVHRSHAYPPRA
jgi:hypothetical protein